MPHSVHPRDTNPLSMRSSVRFLAGLSLLCFVWSTGASADPLLNKAQIAKAATRIDACLDKHSRGTQPKTETCIGLIKHDCEGRISAGGEAAHATCSDNETAAWDVLLNKKWTELSANIEEQRFAALKAVQKSWLAYRDGKCAFLQTDDPTMMGYMNAADCRMTETARRVLELREIQ